MDRCRPRAGLNRRTALAGFSASLALAAFARPGPVGAQDVAPAARFRGVAVDARPLAARGGGASAALIQRILPAKLAEVFAARLAPGDGRAPTIVARIDTLYLSAYADAPTPGFGSLANMDTMEGAGVVLASRQTVSVTPLRVTLPAGYSGAYYLPDIDQRRIDSLCFSFASWLGREMNI